jgi:hypothetical protein
MLVPSNLLDHPIEAPETPVSGVFVVDDLAGNWKRSSGLTGRCRMLLKSEVHWPVRRQVEPE